MKFSVVIPTYRRNEDLLKCVAGLARFAPDHEDGNTGFEVEVLVSDDGRDPELERLLAERFPWVRYLPGPQQGPAANRNNGARAATGEWLAFTDDDCLPQAGWLETFAENTEHPLLEGRTIADRPQERLDEESPMNESGGLLWSCNFAIRKSLFEEIGGFDETFPHAAMEDVDLRVRLEKAGHRPKFLPGAVVVHPFRRVKGADFQQKRYLSAQHFLKLHPERVPESPARQYLHRSLRGFLRISLPGMWRYRCRGALFSLRRDWFFFRLAIRHSPLGRWFTSGK